MLRIISCCVFAASLLVAGVLYKIKYDTRGLQREVLLLSKDIRHERKQLAIAKAEWSFLTRPDEVDRYARSLSLVPLSAEQILSFKDLEQLPFKELVGSDVVTLKDNSSPLKDKSSVMAQKSGGAALFDLTPLYQTSQTSLPDHSSLSERGGR